MVVVKLISLSFMFATEALGWKLNLEGGALMQLTVLTAINNLK
jgi:hypothetical protein